MVIGIDLDNVLSDFTYQWMLALNKTYGIARDYSELTNYNMIWNYPTLTYDEIYSVLDDCEWTPIPDSREVVNRLLIEKHDVYVVTSTPPRHCGAKEKFLRKYFFNDVDSHLITCQDKNRIKLDVIIDDKIENLIRDDACMTIKFNQPWNQNWHGADYEVDSWAEIEKLLIKNVEAFNNAGH